MTATAVQPVPQFRRRPRPTAVNLIFSMIRSKRLYLNDAKASGPAVVQAVRAKFPHAKFGLSQYPWYLSRFRRQKSLGLALDRVVKIPSRERPRRRHGRNAR